MYAFRAPEWVSSIGSTNDELAERLRCGGAVADGAVLAAREQTRGRGRLDRRWLSRPGRDLTFSFVVVPPPSVLPVSLPMAAALGAADALARLGVAGVRVKWPNDVIAPAGKIAGLLAENVALPRGPSGATAVVVGIGLNLGLTRVEAKRIDQPASSVCIETDRVVAPESALPVVLESLAATLRRWLSGGFGAIRADWEARCLYRGGRIRVTEGGVPREGRLHGFGDDGQLLLLDDAGTVREIWSGDVSGLRPA